MTLTSRAKNHSFSKEYYQNKFRGKKVEISNHLQQNPSDLVAKKQIEFIDKVLESKFDELGLDGIS